MAFLKNINYISAGRHLLFWTAYILYYILNEGHDHHEVRAFSFPWQVYTDVPITILICYLNLYLLMPAFYLSRKYLSYFTALLFLLFTGGMISSFLLWRIWLPVEHAIYPAEPSGLWLMGCLLNAATEILPVVVITILLKLMKNACQREKSLREIEKEKFTAEMGLLKAQINPHFFFNTLNSLYALTLAGSDRSPDVVLRLSDMMRYMLYEANADKVFLGDELEYLENYIGIEQMRFGERLNLSFRFYGDIEGKLITPLLLQPFVENAFKCCVENNSGWITIDINVSGGLLFLKAENSFVSKTKPGDNVPELANVKRRLALLYPGAYELQIGDHNGVHRAELKLNL